MHVGDVLAHQAISILVGPALPGMVRGREVNAGRRGGLERRVAVEHGRLHSLGGELKSTGTTGHRLFFSLCRT